MSNKKQKSKFKELFNEKADIMTSDSCYHIRQIRVYIRDLNYYGKVYTITSNKYNKKNVHIIQEFYENEGNENRLRFRVLNLHNAKKFKTIEHLPDGKERKIAVIDSYEGSSEYICSIGNISSYKTDIKAPENNHSLRDINITSLILKRNNIDREEQIKKVA